jgi:dTDP-4-amino-4,6-dideoxygalactose transaminase
MFYATKNITSAEGGALTIAAAELADTLAIMSLHDTSRGAWKPSSAGDQRMGRR